MSQRRPTLVDTNKPGLTYDQTYYRVWQAVLRRRGLIHGRLMDDKDGVCAVQAYFNEANMPISSRAIDEIAAYNDSFPKLSPHKRWLKVKAWLQMEVESRFPSMRGS